MWAIVAIIILSILLMLILRNDRRKTLLRHQEHERKKQRVREEEYDRVEKLAQAGTPELLLTKVKKLEYIEPKPAHRCIEECTYIYGQNGKFELRLARYWDKFKSAWLLKPENLPRRLPSSEGITSRREYSDIPPSNPSGHHP